jgi:hypothetical protein
MALPVPSPGPPRRPGPLHYAAQRFRPTRLRRYRDDPVAFAHDCFDWPTGQRLAPYQQEVLAELPARKKVSARGPHGTGKTTTEAFALLWFAMTRDGDHLDWKCPTTASVWRQLEEYLWPEVHKWARLLRWDVVGRAAFTPARELQDLHLKLRTGSAFAVASNVPANIEGVHADHVLYEFDEAKTIVDGTWDAAEGAFSGTGEALALAMSTPGEPQGRFHQIHRRAAGYEDWWARHVTLDEAIAAGQVSRAWADQRAAQWGVDSAIYQNRVLGEFAASDEAGVIPLAWVEAANERWRAWDRAGRVGRFSGCGVDVGRSGSSDTVIALRYGRAIAEVRRKHRQDTMQTTARVAAALNGHGRGRPAVVDVNGVGAGVVDRLREMGHPVLGFIAGARTDRVDRSGEWRFADCRSAAWWMMRELLDPANGEEVALPPDDLLTGDLTAPRYREQSGGRLRVEAKDEIAKRIGRSTDTADAVIQSFWDGEGEGDGQLGMGDGRWRGRR